MKEIRSGLRHMLAVPWVYDTFQKMVGAYAWRKAVLTQFVSSVIPRNGKLIDIGCGTAEIVKFIPKTVQYIGFDRNPTYIEQARSMCVNANAKFYCEELSPDFALDGAPADIVLALGLIHHLDDEQTVDLLRLAKQLLKSDGFLLTLDPVYEPQQSSLARFIISKDRGTAVRTEGDYMKLARLVCSDVEVFIDRNPLRIPYTGIVMKYFFN